MICNIRSSKAYSNICPYIGRIKENLLIHKIHFYFMPIWYLHTLLNIQKPPLSHSAQKLFETFWITTMKNCGYGRICILYNRIETEEYAMKDNLMKPKQIFVKMFYVSRELYIHSFVLLSVKPSKSYLHMKSVVNLKMMWPSISINLAKNYITKYI